LTWWVFFLIFGRYITPFPSTSLLFSTSGCGLYWLLAVYSLRITWVMIEAMAMGCPVISFARGAAPEIVVHGSTGFLVQHLDEMVQCIPKIDEIDRETARLHVEHHFSSQVMAENYKHIYEKVIARSKKTSGQQKNHFLDQEGTRFNEKIPSARSI
jgi:glycosyltransferase involved in cell wall biosynthesis